MKRMVMSIIIIFLLNCGTQKQACEQEAEVYLDNGLSYESCEHAKMFFVLANTSPASKNPESFSQKSFELSLIFCLRYIQAKRECKDKSTFFPALL